MFFLGFLLIFTFETVLVNLSSLPVDIAVSQGPAQYTGELFGLEYLYSQNGTSFPLEGTDINKVIHR